jgi:glutamate racemase
MIGVFDSGVGGLTVVRALLARRPDLPLVYLGDTARAPYGPKTPETVRRYAEEAVRFLLHEGAEAIVIACNTASALAAEHLRAQFPGVPFFEVVQPAVDAALAATRTGRVGVLATRATVASGVYEARIRAARPDAQVISVAAPLLVPLVEEGWLDTPETFAIVEHYVAPLLAEGVDTVILGCTHYPMIRNVIAAKLGEEIRLVDSADRLAENFCDTIEKDLKLARAVTTGAGRRYLVTDLSPGFDTALTAWLGETSKSEKVSITES